MLHFKTLRTFAALGLCAALMACGSGNEQITPVTTPPVVTPPIVTTAAQLKLQVQNPDGVTLNAAQVSLGALSASTDVQGLASIGNAAAGADQVVVVSKSGYVTQALRTSLATGTATQVLVILQPVQEVLTLPQIELAQVIKAKNLGASVTLPANALVTPANQPATGTVTLQLTPWNISGNDLNAMLGNGRGRNASGALVNLISAGMISVDFFDAKGQRLQLSSASSADIQMDLPYASINGTALSLGSTIPLWHFDETKALWMEEGQGTVVASASSPVGLAVKGSVKHFSTWNWDYAWGGNSSLTVGCVDAQQVGVACSVVANIALQDGSKATLFQALDAASTLVVGVPTTAVVTWSAQTAAGQTGSAVSTGSAKVLIQLSPPVTDNFVQCFLANQVKTACNVVMTSALTNGSTGTQTYRVPVDGGYAKSWLNTPGPLNWKASTDVAANGNGQYVVYNGTATSAVSGAVSIVLSAAAQVSGKSLYFMCDPKADMLDYDYDTVTMMYVTTPYTTSLTSCTITATVLENVTNLEKFTYTLTPAVGVPLQFTVQGDPADSLLVTAVGTTNIATPGAYEVTQTAYSPVVLSSLATNQTMTQRLGGGKTCRGAAYANCF